MNKSIISGRVANEISMKGNDKKIVNFAIAVKREFAKKDEESVDYIDVVAFGQPADFISKYFKKGSPIEVIGRLQKRSYLDKSDKKIYVTEIIIETVAFPPSIGGQGEGVAKEVNKVEIKKPSIVEDFDFEDLF